MIAERRVAEVEREVRRLRQELARRAIKPPKGAGGVRYYTLTIIGGNTLSDGSTLGVKWSASAITTVPSLYDPTVTTSFIDGIGRGTLTPLDGTASSTVLVGHYSGNGSPLNLALFANDIILTSSATVSIPLASDATQSVSVYVPYTP